MIFIRGLVALLILLVSLLGASPLLLKAQSAGSFSRFCYGQTGAALDAIVHVEATEWRKNAGKLTEENIKSRRKGTGFIIGSDEERIFVLTADHILSRQLPQGVRRICVRIGGGAKNVCQEATHLDFGMQFSEFDLGVLSISGVTEPHSFLRLVDSSLHFKGNQNAVGLYGCSRGFKIEPYRDQQREQIRITDFDGVVWKADGDLGPRMSGAPVFNKRGQVFGIVLRGRLDRPVDHVVLPTSHFVSHLRDIIRSSPDRYVEFGLDRSGSSGVGVNHIFIYDGPNPYTR